MRRQDLMTELQFALPILLDAARADDNIPDERVVKLEQRYTVRQSAPDSELKQLVLDGCDLARSMWSDADEDEDLLDLFALAADIEQERRHSESQRREGMQQSTMALTFRKRSSPQ